MNLNGSVGENKTVCFNFSNFGAVRDGETITTPEVFADPDGELTFTTPTILDVAFHDSDGKKVAAGKGVKVRIDATGATAGTVYRIVCRVVTSAGDTIEQSHTYTVTSSLP